MIRTFTRAQQTREHSEPKTILGFFLGFLGIVVAGGVGLAATAFATDNNAVGMAVLAALFAIAVGILMWVAHTHRKDPTALMLGHVTGREFLAYQQWTHGDSSTGVTQAVLIAPAMLAPAEIPLELGQGGSGEGGAGEVEDDGEPVGGDTSDGSPLA